MEICSSSLQTGRLRERMQSLGDGLSGSVYWHALIWHWVKGVSHRLQTHYHITATPANREAAPRTQEELHQRSLIQLPRATCSNKPCLHCVLAGWGVMELFKGHVCRCSDPQRTHTSARTVAATHTSTHTPPHTHTNIQTCTQATRPSNPQPPKHNIGLHQLLKLSWCTLSRKSELVHKSGVDDWTIGLHAKERSSERGFLLNRWAYKIFFLASYKASPIRDPAMEA